MNQSALSKEPEQYTSMLNNFTLAMIKKPLLCFTLYLTVTSPLKTLSVNQYLKLR